MQYTKLANCISGAALEAVRSGTVKLMGCFADASRTTVFAAVNACETDRLGVGC
jgi:hypothetical protein